MKNVMIRSILGTFFILAGIVSLSVFLFEVGHTPVSECCCMGGGLIVLGLAVISNEMSGLVGLVASAAYIVFVIVGAMDQASVFYIVGCFLGSIVASFVACIGAEFILELLKGDDWMVEFPCPLETI